MEQPGLCRPVTLADDEFQPATGEMVERRVVLEGAHRIEQAQRRHRGEQPDGRRPRGDMAQDDRRRRRDERALVPLPDAVPVEAQLFGEDSVFHYFAQALRGGLLDPGDGIRDMRDERDGEELHAESPLQYSTCVAGNQGHRLAGAAHDSGVMLTPRAARAFDTGSPMPLVGQGSPRWSSTGLFGSAGGNLRLPPCRDRPRIPKPAPRGPSLRPTLPPSYAACPGRVASAQQCCFYPTLSGRPCRDERAATAPPARERAAADRTSRCLPGVATWPAPATLVRGSRAAPRAGPSAAASRRGAPPA